MVFDMVFDMINFKFEICKRFALGFVQINVKKRLSFVSGKAFAVSERVWLNRSKEQ